MTNNSALFFFTLSPPNRFIKNLISLIEKQPSGCFFRPVITSVILLLDSFTLSNVKYFTGYNHQPHIAKTVFKKCLIKTDELLVKYA